MERTDYIENRMDVVKNIYTLYSYAHSVKPETRDWAVERYSLGQCYVVESFGGTLLFAPSRFVGYKDNTVEKHSLNPGDGRDTNRKLLELKLYKEAPDKEMCDFLAEQFDSFMAPFSIAKKTPKFYIPFQTELDDLKREHSCYFICPTHCAGQKDYAWSGFLNKKLMAIGWEDEDYTRLTADEIQKIYEDSDPSAIDPFYYMKQIRPGDVVCCTHNNYGLWGIGIALSGYKFSKQIHDAGWDEDGNRCYYSHYVDVAWLRFKKEAYIAKDEFAIQPPETAWPPYGTLNMKQFVPTYISNYILYLGEMTKKNDKLEYYQRLLESNRNLILTGAPGTGKTYLAKAIADKMGAVSGFVQFHPSYDYTDFVEGLRPTPPNQQGVIGFKRVNGVFKAFCEKAIEGVLNAANADSYKEALENFKRELEGTPVDIQSFRSKTMVHVELEPERCVIIVNNKIGQKSWSVSDERMLAYLISGTCPDNDTYLKTIGDYIKANYLTENLEEGQQRQSVPYVFIIDEINRGEMSKIFGELFFSIDPGYRGMKGQVKTQYQNLITDESDPFFEGFYVPENVYIIGTMNDIDRSVESMDFAMRRRFAWAEVKASENVGMLDELDTLKADVVEVMNRLNKAIWDEETQTGIDGLGAAYHIGGAYFRKLSLYLDASGSNWEEALTHLWENHLQGVLFEYLRGREDAAKQLQELEKAFWGVMG